MPGRSPEREHRRVACSSWPACQAGQAQAARHLLEAHLAAALVRAGRGERAARDSHAARSLDRPLRAGPRARGAPGAARRLRFGSSTVPFEQIGQSATKRLWRQNVRHSPPNLEARLCQHACRCGPPSSPTCISARLADADVARHGEAARGPGRGGVGRRPARAARRHRRAARAPACRRARGEPAGARGARPRDGGPAGGDRARQPRPRARASRGSRGCGWRARSCRAEAEWPVEPGRRSGRAHRGVDAGRGAHARLPGAAPARRTSTRPTATTSTCT